MEATASSRGASRGRRAFEELKYKCLDGIIQLKLHYAGLINIVNTQEAEAATARRINDRQN